MATTGRPPGSTSATVDKDDPGGCSSRPRSVKAAVLLVSERRVPARRSLHRLTVGALKRLPWLPRTAEARLMRWVEGTIDDGGLR